VGLIEGLVAMGYRENEDFVIGVRFTQGDSTVLPAVARELARDGVDILFGIGESAAKAAQQATTTHPIVFSGVGDPVGQGLINSYARPGGNITGVADLNMELSAKRLELFQELLPGLKRVLCPYHANNAYQVAVLMQYRAAAQRLGLVLVEWKLHTIEEARDALASVRRVDVDGMLGPRDTDLNIPGFVLDATARQGIPSMFDAAFYLKDGGLASYGPPCSPRGGRWRGWWTRSSKA
jgi:putative ABC transport system substrate-binding protein